MPTRPQIRVDGAGAPTVNRALGVLQGVFHRAVEWRRLAWNPVVGVRRISHTRSETIDARTPETVEAIRAQLDPGDAALVSVLAYEGLRPGEAYALVWGDVLDERGRPRKRLAVRRALSGEEVSTTKSGRGREPELFAPVARELMELYVSPRAARHVDARLPRQRGRPPAAAELAAARLDPRARARRRSPTSAATTSATPAPRCCSTRAAPSTRSPSTSATPTPASPRAPTRT